MECQIYTGRILNYLIMSGILIRHFYIGAFHSIAVMFQHTFVSYPLTGYYPVSWCSLKILFLLAIDVIGFEENIGRIYHFVCHRIKKPPKENSVSGLISVF